MRFIFSLLSLVLLAQPALAVRFIVQNPCSPTPWLNVTAAAVVGDSVGHATIATLDRERIEYLGNEQGINSIKGTVTGDPALEIISGHEMRAYGWCYRINNREPSDFPDQVKIGGNNDVIYWVFGFAHYLNGEWVSMCTPTHLIRPTHICPQS